MFTKTLIAAFLVASTALALTSQVNAGPAKQRTAAEQAYMERASKAYDGGGY